MWGSGQGRRVGLSGAGGGILAWIDSVCCMGLGLKKLYLDAHTHYTRDCTMRWSQTYRMRVEDCREFGSFPLLTT